MDTAKLDLDLAVLRNRADIWARFPIRNVISHLREAIEGYAAIAEEQVTAALDAKGFGRYLAGEEALTGPIPTLRNMRLLLRTIEQIEKHGRPQLPKLRRLPSGQIAVPAFPTDHYDRVFYAGFNGEVWLQRDVTEPQLYEEIAAPYRSPSAGKVSLVLAAGNVASLVPLDALYKLFVERRVVLLKINPVNGYMARFTERAFASMVREGFLRIVDGGVDVGEYLCAHPQIDDIHMTGSDRTHDAIVYGVGEQGSRRKAERSPRLQKPITSELGNVSPLIVVPGKWSRSDLRFHAENVATQLCNNAGFNCNALRVLVTAKDWPQRHAFLDAIGKVLGQVPPRTAYYPGARDRYEAFSSAPGKLREYGAHADGKLPWGLLIDVDPEDREHIAFRQEAFCSFAAETALPAADAVDFCRRAARFCNDVLWGTLNATVLVHPRSERALGEHLNQLIQHLRYGSIAVNQWAAMSYLAGTTSWGAFPGHPLHDIQSGRGVVHNAMMLPRVERSVLHAPFRVFPPPPWYVTNPRLAKLAPRLIKFEANPNPWALPRIFEAVLRG
jgi:hypothetical protein